VTSYQSTSTIVNFSFTDNNGGNGLTSGTTYYYTVCGYNASSGSLAVSLVAPTWLYQVAFTTSGATSSYSNSGNAGANSYVYGVSGVAGYLGATDPQATNLGNPAPWSGTYQDLYQMNLTAGTTYKIVQTFTSGSTATYTWCCLTPGGASSGGITNYQIFAACNAGEASNTCPAVSANTTGFPAAFTSSNVGTVTTTSAGVNTITYTPSTSGTYLFSAANWDQGTAYAYNYTLSISYVTPVGAPAPTGLTATLGTSGSVILNWTASTEAGVTYNVYRGTTAGGESTTPIATGVTGTTYTDASLSGGTYYYTVSSVDSNGVGVPTSNETSIVIFVAIALNIPSGGGTTTVTGGVGGTDYAAGPGKGYWWGVQSTGVSSYYLPSSGWLGATSTQSGAVQTPQYAGSWNYIPQIFYSVQLQTGLTYVFTVTETSGQPYTQLSLSKGAGLSASNTQVAYSQSYTSSYNYYSGVSTSSTIIYTPTTSGTYWLSVGTSVPYYYYYYYTLTASQGLPIVSSVSPSGGPAAGGTTVTVNGSGFTGATSVQFGGTTISSSGFTVNGTGTAITVVAPAGATGTGVDITVTTTLGTSPTSAADQFSYGAATFSPTVVPSVPYSNSGVCNGITRFKISIP
jgi:hypothetical protein